MLRQDQPVTNGTIASMCKSENADDDKDDTDKWLVTGDPVASLDLAFQLVRYFFG